MRRVLVAGGAGFLGSHLCERLLDDGHHVVCLDNLSTERLRRSRGCATEGRSSFTPRVIDPLKIDVDQIYNLACPASPIQYQRDPVLTTKTSVYGAVNMLDLAERLRVPILQASTSEVYGDPDVHPQTEIYWGRVNPIGVRSCYDEGKRCAETLFFDYYRQYGTDIKVARIFNTYGPRMHPQDGRVVSNFMVQALRGEDISIYGRGDQRRSFCFVSDTIDGLVRLMEKPPNFTGPVNIGSRDEISVLDLAQMVIAGCGTKSKIVFHALPQDDPRRRQPAIELAQSELGWAPTVALEQGLRATIDYFKARLAAQP